MSSAADGGWFGRLTGWIIFPVDLLALIATVAGVISAVGVPIAYLQLRTERAQLRAERSHQHAHAAGALDPRIAGLDDLAMFVPTARYRGFDVGLVDRRAESAALVRQVRAGRSVITIEGPMGIGKTTLAAHICRQVRGRDIRWVFCDEKGATLTLTALAKALAGIDPAAAVPIRTAILRRATSSDMADAVIDYLTTHRMLLVLDNFHVVTDPGLHTLLTRLEHTSSPSVVILTSRTRIAELHALPLVAQTEIAGLSAADTRQLLARRGVSLSTHDSHTVWQHAGNGNPLALVLFAGRARTITQPEQLMTHLPDSADDLNEWIAPVFADLSPDAVRVAKIIAFAYGSISRDVLRTVAAPLAPENALADLNERFLVTGDAGALEMHSVVRDYVSEQTTETEQADLAHRFTDYYREHARTVFLQGLGHDEPSYGTLYLECFPDYFAATERHMRFVGDLLDRVADHGHALARGDRILVLGSGDGTHDPGFAKHGLTITDVDIQPEIAAAGRTKAAALPADITYVVTDMTTPLPPEIADRTMAAVFNIGSSFGYEDSDAANAMVFRNAANALRDDAPFVFEFVNGPHWTNKRVQRQVDVTPLPNGSTRTEVTITDPDAGTSLTLIELRRPDGTGGWFRHFMRYYRLPEIIDMMTGAGLRVIATYGARDGRVTGEPFDEHRSEAMVIVAVPDR